MKRLIDEALRRELQIICIQNIKETPEELFSDLRMVGQAKPLGCLPVSTIKKICHTSSKALIKDATVRGLSTEIIGKRQKALYVWDHRALGTLLQDNRVILEDAGWSLDPRSFVHMVEDVIAEEQTVLYDLIADAFADYISPGRLYVEEDRLPDLLKKL